jgi:hypothetical protein
MNLTGLTIEEVLAGTSSKEIRVFIENDPNIKEGNEDYFTYPENLYTLLLQSKDVNIEFAKPIYMNIKNYNYEWTRTFYFIFLQINRQLSEECNKSTCPEMKAGKDWQFLCTVHGKDTKNCCAIDYVSHNIGTTLQVLLNPSFYPDRFEIGDRPAKAFPKMIKYLCRTLAHIFFHHSNLFQTLEEKIKICERLTLYCKKF